ncbi:hypothetical protein TNCV_4595881 [Trichonephila clavipes]|uniref:Uncharacterized protein n=1 Tax=Trichonephila clavipes TaxID=2585209 RepID=A0A8X6WFI6_TRICX|nr:hypothetical protein TNCV_4595881 [Trichonephila clavipes]
MALDNSLDLTLNVRKNDLCPTAFRPITLDTINTRYLFDEWLHIYTHGSLLDFTQGASVEVFFDLFSFYSMSALIRLILTVKSRAFIWSFISFLPVSLLLIRL